jgi:orotate phosphoribosyltransferase
MDVTEKGIDKKRRLLEILVSTKTVQIGKDLPLAKEYEKGNSEDIFRVNRDNFMNEGALIKAVVDYIVTDMSVRGLDNGGLGSGYDIIFSMPYNALTIGSTVVKEINREYSKDKESSIRHAYFRRTMGENQIEEENLSGEFEDGDEVLIFDEIVNGGKSIIDRWRELKRVTEEKGKHIKLYAVVSCLDLNRMCKVNDRLVPAKDRLVELLSTEEGKHVPVTSILSMQDVFEYVKEMGHEYKEGPLKGRKIVDKDMMDEFHRLHLSRQYIMNVKNGLRIDSGKECYY